MFELVKHILQLDVLRQLLVLGGGGCELFPNDPVPAFLVLEFSLGQNVMG